METTDYSGMFVYKDGHIDYFLTSEGRMKRNSDGSYFAEYFIKDHLGNVRLVYKEAVKSKKYPTYYNLQKKDDYGVSEGGSTSSKFFDFRSQNIEMAEKKRSTYIIGGRSLEKIMITPIPTTQMILYEQK